MGNKSSLDTFSSKSVPEKRQFIYRYFFLPIFKWANYLLIFFTFLAYVSPYINPNTYWAFSFFGLLYPWLLLSNLLFIVLWLILKEKYFFYSLIAILLGAAQVKSIAGWTLNSSFEDTTTTLSIMTFNCHGLRDRNNDNKRFSFNELKSLTQLEKLDILCLQEFLFIRELSPYISKIKEQTNLPYHFYDSEHGLILFSAYPILDQGATYFGNRANGFQFVDIKTKNKTIRIYNVHLQSNQVTGTAAKVAKEGNLKEKETRSAIKSMLRRYRSATKKRALQAGIIQKHMEESPHPVVLCGDLNDVPQSYAYKKIASNLKDGFKKKGNGLGFTFLGDIPGLRIDYILASPELKFNGYKHGALYFSDHVPVVGNIRLN